MKKLLILLFLFFSIQVMADYKRGIENYQLILQGTKQINDLSQEELMEVIYVQQVLNKSSSSDDEEEELENACDDALSKCKRYCVADDCYYACKKGHSYCLDESNADDGCYEFKRRCERYCETPNCIDSCYQGKRSCY